MKSIKVSDEMGNRSRLRDIVIARGERLERFTGKAIPGLVVVQSDRYVKSGKWSHSEYVLGVADDTVVGTLWQDFDNGRWFGKATDWPSACKELQNALRDWQNTNTAPSAAACETFIRQHYLATSERLDQIAADLAALG